MVRVPAASSATAVWPVAPVVNARLLIVNSVFYPAIDYTTYNYRLVFIMLIDEDALLLLSQWLKEALVPMCVPRAFACRHHFFIY